jgi:hypothetical protein
MQSYLFEGAAETERSCSALAGMPADLATLTELPGTAFVFQQYDMISAQPRWAAISIKHPRTMSHEGFGIANVSALQYIVVSIY